MTETTNKESPRARARSVVGRLALDFQKTDKKDQWSPWTKGDIAQFRRLDVKRRQVLDAAFWRLSATVLEPETLLDEGSSEERVSQWMAIIQALAVAYRTHVPKLRIGRAMQQADVSERRLMRLLRAEGDGLLSEARRVARQLQGRGQGVDLADLAILILSDEDPDREKVRRGIATDYFHQQYKSNTSDSETAQKTA